MPTDEYLNLKNEADNKINQMRRSAQDEEAIRLGGSTLKRPEMTPEQQGRWEASVASSQAAQAAEPLKTRVTRHGTTGPVELGPAKVATEIAAGATPAGVAIDVKDLATAIRSNDTLGMVMAGVGFLPVFGDSAKAVFKAIRAGDRSKDAMKMAEKILSEQKQGQDLADFLDGSIDYAQAVDRGIDPEILRTTMVFRPELAPPAPPIDLKAGWEKIQAMIKEYEG